MPHHKLGIVAYGPSDSAKLLRTKLHLARFNEGHTYGTLINWGSSTTRQNFQKIVNKPQAIVVCTDKVKTYEKLKEANVHTLDHTRENNVAKTYGFPLIVRTNFLKGGKGIVVLRNLYELELVRNPLGPNQFFSRFYPSRSEYRVHVLRDKLLGWQKKVLIEEENEEEHNLLIRNHDNGWKFSLRTTECPPQMKDVAINAVKAVGLDFGAVDILYDNNHVYRVLEVNSAPGLDDGTIANKYVEEFNGMKNE